ncbi:bifunctional sugar phosphate isomerase/epimerase/4-hydroxyphenylpyruvate dioxygenase family protein [Variovorax sp. PAMC26660]|uniref:bifunctional sugar phosphate isomerase/epimerase/4-hydroxyphenylpyruvate dioxygenase family protein n=1 Tax=Variovorax sp. PAMC26660 TaxID=2762322 RepID=UPI00164D6472|nr:sugar phosphate isomerase/epimerase and 4-hydroxyphenylpyruvate domain-containing protein [Variovorax sp. PAMC26660]QNK66339.1 sugar phosphate isomerase/epimerase and 4-hydroxyphenylpyruvate domain-containing protein [Variovorax sp. PAMC26660]
MHRSIATVSLSGTLRQKLEAVSAAGFDGIELFEADFINFKGTAAELRGIVADLGLAIDLYQPFRDFEGMPEPQFRRSLERAERKFDLMEAMGAPMVLCCSNTSPLAINDPARAAAQLHELAERAARRNLRVGFEALAWGRHTSLYRQAWDIVKQANHAHLGLILDSFHTLSLKDDPAGIVDIPGDKIFFLQMADAPLLAMDVLQWARHHRSFPGQGDFEVVGFFEKVLLAGYTGPLSLEIFNDIFRETPNRRTAVDAMRSLLYLESETRQRLASAANAPAQPQRVELFHPPAAPALSGLSFIEFAADEASAETLGTLLRQLGFRRVGTHRSKAVTLYRQGETHLIVNAQPDSFARSRFDAHGTSVCALGVRCADPLAAVGRATAMRSQRHDSPVGPNEMRVPAVIAPGGNLIHFVPEALGANGLYEADFILEEDEGEAANDAGLQRIDHVALGLALDQLDTWVLFTRAVLGLEPGESLELADPFGLIRSRGVANADRRLRLVLNVSLSQRTRTARTLSVTGGGAVHHIALSCEDIFDSVARLRANGTRFVPISDNYYDDLATRIDIAPELLARMRAAGVLFDRSPAGDYLHIYTESFEGGLFFEVAQRVGAYDAYGALNAPARMASQAQD